MLNDHVFQLCAMWAIISGTFVYLVSPGRMRARRLGKALQGLSERYATEVQRQTAERQEWAGERIVLKGIINADTKRAEELMQRLEVLKKDRVNAHFHVVQVQNTLTAAADSMSHLKHEVQGNLGSVARMLDTSCGGLILIRSLCE